MKADWKEVIIAAMAAVAFCYSISRMAGCSEVVYTHNPPAQSSKFNGVVETPHAAATPQ